MTPHGKLGLLGRTRRVVLRVMLTPLAVLGGLFLLVAETPLVESLARPLVVFAPAGSCTRSGSSDRARRPRSS